MVPRMLHCVNNKHQAARSDHMRETQTVKETAKKLGTAESTVRRLIREGDLPSIRISPRRIIIPVAAFEAWLNDRAKQGA